MDGKPFSEKLAYLLNHTKFERLINEKSEIAVAFNRLLDSAEKSEFSPDVFFSLKALETDIDSLSFNVEKVTLMTLHAAKGLEFPIVFIIGCEDDLIPLRRGESEVGQLDEERRLFFVAMTRAKERLFLTWAKKRRRFGKHIDRQISPFVLDISEDVVVRQEPVFGKRRRQVQTQMKLF
jgi:superfamily I DNA/RNA helicase